MGTDGRVFLAVGLPADVLLRSPHVSEDDLVAWRYLETGNLWDRRVQRRLPRGLIMMPVGDHDDLGTHSEWSRFLVGVKLWEAEKRGDIQPARAISADEIRKTLLDVEMGLFELDLVNPPKPRLLLCTTYSG